jgi:hypothetical protein
MTKNDIKVNWIMYIWMKINGSETKDGTKISIYTTSLGDIP